MTPHEIIAGLLAGIDDAEGSGPVWDAELLAAAREYLASPEDAPAPLPEPDLSEPAGGAAIEGGARPAEPVRWRRDDPPKMVTITLQDYALPPECGRYSQAEILRGQGPGEFFGALTKALFDLQRGPGGVLLRSFVTGGEAPR